MRFPPQFLDELRARLPVSEVVGRRVRLKKAGREWRGLSPFNKEKTPSFFVNDQKMAWFDFSSGKNGNIFDFVMMTEGLSFPEAVERLAGEAGLPLPTISREEEARDERRKTLHDVMELAAKFFEATLAARAGAKARGYLADRGLDPATQVKFRLGYAPAERFALKEHLGKEGISIEDMIEAGLLVAGDDIPVPYDRFRDRVMFPITDLRGRVIAFGGRALEKDAQAKYLNSPETPLFHKGGTLYNIAAARAAAHKGAPVIAVEGYVDVIAMVTAGFEATVAPLGTALTADQLGLLWKMADEPMLCFDGDSRRAARRLSRRRSGAAADPGRQEPALRQPAGRPRPRRPRARGRPRRDRRGARRARARSPTCCGCARPRPAASTRRSGAPRSRRGSPRSRRPSATNRCANIIARSSATGCGSCSRPTSGRRCGRGQAEWRTAIGGTRPGARKTNRNSAPGVRNPAFAMRSVAGEPYVVASPQLAASPVHRGDRAAIPRREALILQAVLNHPWLLHDHLEDLADVEFRHRRGGPGEGRADRHLCPWRRARWRGMAAELARRGLAEVAARIEKAITTPSVWGAQPEAAPDDVLMTWKQLVALHRQWHSLIKELKDAEQALGQETTEANYSWLQDVKARLRGPRRNRGADRGLWSLVRPGGSVAVTCGTIGKPRRGPGNFAEPGEAFGFRCMEG